ncbi:MAG: hypothetical protein QME75_04310 [Deltaproteobacteria bacterium]|nr:hypothetical protein [Deltaproteobacteria bacterium]
MIEAEGGAKIDFEHYLGGMVDLVFLLVPIALLGGFSLVYYFMAKPNHGRTWKLGNKARAEAILQEFERQYKHGKITRAQFENILIKYFPKDRN